MSAEAATLRLSWKVVAALEPHERRGEAPCLFIESDNTRFLRQLGVHDRELTPVLLRPTVVFHQAIGKLLRRRVGINQPLRRLPYRFVVAQLGDVAVNIKIRLFRPWAVCLTVSVSGASSLGNGLDVPSLVDIQNVRDLHPLGQIVEWTIGIVQAGSQKRFTVPDHFTAKPALHLAGIAPVSEFEEFIDSHRRQLAAVVVRAREPTLMTDRIVDAVWEKCADVNAKSVRDQFLLDKQGLLFVTARPEHKDDTWTFRRFADLYELALVSAAFLEEQRHPIARSPAGAQETFEVIRGLVSEPSATFHAGARTGFAWGLLLDEFKLKARWRELVRRRRFGQRGVKERLVRATSRLSVRWVEGLGLGVLAGIIVWLVTR